MLAENQPAFRNSHALRVNDLVCGFFFEIPVLVDACLVSKRVLANDRLVRLRTETDQARKHLARRIELLGMNTSMKGVMVASGLERHHNFLKRRVSSSLPDPVNRAFHLASASLYSRQRICDS